LTKEDREYIRKNHGTKSVAEMANALDRSEDIISRHLGTILTEGPQKESVDKLKASEAWKRLQRELTPDELRFFAEEYAILLDQFRGDVLPTERMQIFDCIKLEILKSRNLVERRRAREDIVKLQQLLQDLFGRFASVADMSAEDRDMARSLEEQVQAARAAEQSRTSEYTKLQERLDALMKTLKGTRDQRIKEVTSDKETILGLFKKLQQKEIQEKEGRQAALMRLAVEKEKKRMGERRTYLDGQLDRPLLSPETVEEEQ
jgi:hypothetical protein